MPDQNKVLTEKAGIRYCAVCGQEVNADGLGRERFGEVFCSEAHAEEFAAEVRTTRVQTAATLAVQVEPKAEQPGAACAPGQQGWKRYLKWGACCGAPLLALVFLAGGGGVVLGAAGAVVPYLVALACPLGMYFMMRAMSKMGQKGGPHDKGG